MLEFETPNAETPVSSLLLPFTALLLVSQISASESFYQRLARIYESGQYRDKLLLKMPHVRSSKRFSDFLEKNTKMLHSIMRTMQSTSQVYDHSYSDRDSVAMTLGEYYADFVGSLRKAD